MGHAETVPLIHAGGGNVLEGAVAAVPIKVQTGEIGDYGEVKVPVPVKVKQGGTEGPAVPLGGKAGLLRLVREVSLAIIDQQIVRESIVGVVIGGRHGPLGIGCFPLTGKEVQVAIAIHIPRGQDVQIGQFPGEAGHWRIGKAPSGLAGKKEHRLIRSGPSDVVGEAVSVEVGQNAGFHRLTDAMAEKIPFLKLEFPLVVIDEIAAREDDFGQAIPIQVVDQDRAGAGKAAGGFHFRIQHPFFLKHGSTFPRQQPQAGRFKFLRHRFGFRVGGFLPPHLELPPDDDPLGVAAVKRMDLKGNRGARGILRRGGIKTGMVPLGLGNLPSPCLKGAQQQFIVGMGKRPQRRAEIRRHDPLHPQIGRRARLGSPQQQPGELKTLKGLERLAGPHRIPKPDKSLFMTLGGSFIRIKRGVQHPALLAQLLHRWKIRGRRRLGLVLSPQRGRARERETQNPSPPHRGWDRDAFTVGKTAHKDGSCNCSQHGCREKDEESRGRCQVPANPE